MSRFYHFLAIGACALLKDASGKERLVCCYSASFPAAFPLPFQEERWWRKTKHKQFWFNCNDLGYKQRIRSKSTTAFNLIENSERLPKKWKTSRGEVVHEYFRYSKSLFLNQNLSVSSSIRIHFHRQHQSLGRFHKTDSDWSITSRTI